jgi:hypothetical protein
MDQLTTERVVNAISAWANRQKDPDEPAVELCGIGEYSPRQLAEEVKTGSAAGALFLDIIETALQRFPLETVLSRFIGAEAVYRADHGT